MSAPLHIERDLTDPERSLFDALFQRRKKRIWLGVTLGLLLGYGGSHRFYLGQKAIGLL